MLDFFEKEFGHSESTPLSLLGQQLRTVSIRGRVAYCISCLEIALAAENIALADVKLLLSCLWNFTNNPDLREWKEKAMDFYSESILEDHAQNRLSSAHIRQLAVAYSSLSQDLLTCVDETIEVGRGNLYGGVVGHSECTLAPTMYIIRFMNKKGCPLPSIKNFLRSPFTEEDMHGWGKRVDRDFFQ